MNSKLEEAEEQINDLEDKVMESSEAEEDKEELSNARIDLRHSVTPSNVKTIMIGVPEEDREKGTDN